MITITNTDTYGWEAAIRGMRNPMNSWDLSDSEFVDVFDDYDDLKSYYIATADIGENDLKLMKKLSKAGTDHSKFMRMITVTCDITAPLYWWKEFDTYKVGTVANSCSTMHKIQAKEFALEDFSKDKLTPSSIYILSQFIISLNFWREAFLINDDDERKKYILKRFEPDYSGNDFSKKTCWWQMIQLLPSSYNQKRTIQLNYQVLKNIYHARKNHKLDEWHHLCDWIKTLPYSELITMED